MDNDIEFDEQETGRNPLRDRMKQLESENATLKAWANEALDATRELAFVKAGIDSADPMAKYFVKGYDGELSPDAIRAAAIEARLIQDTKAVQVAQEAKGWDRTNQAASGNTVGEAPVDMVTRISKATSQAEIEMLLAEVRSLQQN